MLKVVKPVRKADLVEASLLDQLRFELSFTDLDYAEIKRLALELAYLDEHRSEYRR